MYLYMYFFHLKLNTFACLEFVSINYSHYTTCITCLVLQECISKSVIQTKFEAHAFSGLKIANTLKDFMEQRVDSASQQR